MSTVPTPRTPPTRPRSGPARLRAVSDPAAAAQRAEQRETFRMVLRTRLSRRGTPYSTGTIGAYLDAVDSLARWMTDTGHPGASNSLRVEDLNAYLAAYHLAHGQNGTLPE